MHPTWHFCTSSEVCGHLSYTCVGSDSSLRHFIYGRSISWGTFNLVAFAREIGWSWMSVLGEHQPSCIHWLLCPGSVVHWQLLAWNDAEWHAHSCSERIFWRHTLAFAFRLVSLSLQCGNARFLTDYVLLLGALTVYQPYVKPLALSVTTTNMEKYV